MYFLRCDIYINVLYVDFKLVFTKTADTKTYRAVAVNTGTRMSKVNGIYDTVAS